MSKPTREQLQEVFTALVRNGLDFFLRSAHELDKEQKFAIAHFATGIELILKARLFQEDWTLIATKPHECAWDDVEKGTIQTLQATALCEAITKRTGTPLEHEKDAFKRVFNHRNRVLHWAPNGDLASTVAEQCVAWHYLHELLARQWGDEFSSFRAPVEKVEQALRAHRTYLAVRFLTSEETLHEAEKAGLLLDCPVCRFRAGIAKVGSERVVPFKCRVCEYDASTARVSCGALFALDALPVEDCKCGGMHDGAQLIDELDPPNPKGEPDRGFCGNCSCADPSVVRDGETYVCIGCGGRFNEKDSTACEWCNERWYGRDLEGSYLSGCGFCGGREMDDD